MADDHRFVDAANSAIDGKTACIDAWRSFFAAFPDYGNTFESVVVTEDQRAAAPQMARMRLFRALCSSSARPRCSRAGGM